MADKDEAFGKRLSFLRDVKKLTQEEAGPLIGLSYGSIQRHESGYWPNQNAIKKYLNFYGCNKGWLLTGIGQPWDVPLENLPEYTGEKPPFIHPQMMAKQEPEPPGGMAEFFDTIPMAEARLSAGGGAVVQSETFAERFAFRKAWLRKIASSREAAILMMVEGDSMEPEISDGDMVMIDRGRTEITPGKIYAIGVSDTIMIKRLDLLAENKVRVISKNDDYPPYVIDRENLRVIGQVVWFARELIRRDNGV